MEDVSKLYKPQLENSSQLENIKTLLYESDNEIKDIIKLNKLSQFQNSLS